VAHVCVDVLVGEAAQAVVLVRVPLRNRKQEVTHMPRCTTPYMCVSVLNTHHGLKVDFIVHQGFRDLRCLLEVDIVWKQQKQHQKIT